MSALRHSRHAHAGRIDQKDAQSLHASKSLWTLGQACGAPLERALKLGRSVREQGPGWAPSLALSGVPANPVASVQQTGCWLLDRYLQHNPNCTQNPRKSDQSRSCGSSRVHARVILRKQEDMLESVPQDHGVMCLIRSTLVICIIRLQVGG